MFPFKEIEFTTFDGIKLGGNLYIADISNAPIVIMTHGNLQQFAEKFSANGIAALVYDHRGYGESEGPSRNETNITQQVEDSHDAVTYARTLTPAIDPHKIAVWGIGHSGGMSIIAAALDSRIAAALIIMPWTSGSNDKKFMPMDQVWKSREARLNEYISPWPESEEEALSIPPKTLLAGKDLWQFIQDSRQKSLARAGNPHINKLSLQSFYHISKLEPQDYVSSIAPRPLLYSAARIDTLTGSIENHESVFKRASEPKQFPIMENEHLATYRPQEAYFVSNTDVWIDFVKKYLG